MAIYLLERVDPPPLKTFTILDTPLSGKCAAVRGLRVTMRQSKKYGKKIKRNE